MLAVLLLPQPYDALPSDHAARDLDRADGVATVDPPRMGYARQARLPGDLADALASIQARRLLRALDRPVAAVALFEPHAYPLARGLVAVAGCELWYASPTPEPAGSQRLRRRLEALDAQARARSALRFTTTPPLWERMAQLGVDIRVSRL